MQWCARRRFSQNSQHEKLNFSWQLDFWGRQASLVKQARSEASAAALDAAAARQAIVSAVVSTYIDLEHYDITRHRLKAGPWCSWVPVGSSAVPQPARLLAERSRVESALLQGMQDIVSMSSCSRLRYRRLIRKRTLDLNTSSYSPLA